MKYDEAIAAIKSHLVELEALVSQLPTPAQDLADIDVRLTALIGTVTAKAGQ